jgi:hypothetical protein
MCLGVHHRYISNGDELPYSNGEVNISHENTTMVVWIYDGV